MNEYIFTSKRLGFRFWKKSDIDDFYKMVSNKEVMRFFPSLKNMEEAIKQLDYFISFQEKNEFIFYAVETITEKEFVGFLGITKVNKELHFSPAIEIGWRFMPKFWNKGLATEGAKACLKHSFNTFNFKEIYAFTSYSNIPSEKVMQKIGMKKIEEFIYPDMDENHELQPMILYKVNRL